MSFFPQAFDAAQGVQEGSDTLAPLFGNGREWGAQVLPIDDNPGSAQATNPIDSRAPIEPAKPWYTQPPIDPLTEAVSHPANGRWYLWSGQTPLTISLPQDKDVRSIYLPFSGASITINSGLASGGGGLYTSIALAELVPLPSGNQIVTLVSNSGIFASPMSVFATNDVLPPFRTSGTITPPTPPNAYDIAILARAGLKHYYPMNQAAGSASAPDLGPGGVPMLFNGNVSSLRSPLTTDNCMYCVPGRNGRILRYLFAILQCHEYDLGAWIVVV